MGFELLAWTAIDCVRLAWEALSQGLNSFSTTHCELLSLRRRGRRFKERRAMVLLIGVIGMVALVAPLSAQ